MHPRSQVLIYVSAGGRRKQHDKRSEILSEPETCTHTLIRPQQRKKEPPFQILHGCLYGYFYESMCRMRNKEYQQAEAQLRGS